jgi:hypothetical protein
MFNISFVENMGNCCGHFCPDHPRLEGTTNSEMRFQMSLDTMAYENRALRNQLSIFQNQNTELLTQKYELERERVDLTETLRKTESTLQQKETELDNFMDEVASSAYKDDIAHMETYQKLTKCLKEKMELKQELNQKS